MITKYNFNPHRSIIDSAGFVYFVLKNKRFCRKYAHFCKAGCETRILTLLFKCIIVTFCTINILISLKYGESFAHY